MLDKPIDNWIDVGRVFAWDHIAAYLSISNRFESPAEYKISFITEVEYLETLD